MGGAICGKRAMSSKNKRQAPVPDKAWTPATGFWLAISGPYANAIDLAMKSGTPEIGAYSWSVSDAMTRSSARLTLGST